MTAVAEILDDLRRRQVTVEVVSNKLRITAPAGVVEPPLLDRLRKNKAAIIRALSPHSKGRRLDRGPKAVCRVTVGGRDHPVVFWEGTPLAAGVVAIDTETDVIGDKGRIPRLALISASVGEGAVILRPDQVADFLTAHGDRHFVLHNIAFDFWVLHEHLLTTSGTAPAQLLWKLAETGQFHDTMLLDGLVSIAETGKPGERNLAEVANRWAGITELDKSDPYRLRFGELLDQNWRRVDRGFFEYAAMDPIATWHTWPRLFGRERTPTLSLPRSSTA